MEIKKKSSRSRIFQMLKRKPFDVPLLTRYLMLFNKETVLQARFGGSWFSYNL